MLGLGAGCSSPTSGSVPEGCAPQVKLEVIYHNNGPACAGLTAEERASHTMHLEKHSALVRRAVVYVARKCCGKTRVFSKIVAHKHSAYLVLHLINKGVLESRGQEYPRRNLAAELSRKADCCLHHCLARYERLLAGEISPVRLSGL